MNTLSRTIAEGFRQCFDRLTRQIHELATPVSDEEFWRRPFPYGNSFGHLVLHLTGNLNYYIGSQIAQTGYVRDRDREFAETERPPKEVVLRRLDEAVAMVVATLERQAADDWSTAYTALREQNVGNRFGIFLKCAVHFDHHVGQMNYLVKELSRSGRVDSAHPSPR